MFLSKLFSMFKKNKEPEQQTSGDSNPKSGNVVTPGTVAGGTAASSGASDPNTPQPSQSNPLADGSGQQPASGDIASSQSTDMSEQDDIGNVAQADSAPAYPGEESPSDASSGSETTETVTPETDNYQSGSTDEDPKLPPDDSSPQQPDSGSSESDDESGAPGSDDQAGGSAGPSIG